MPGLGELGQLELIILDDTGQTGDTTMPDQMHTAADRLYEHMTNPG
jgi:hypothetical protein